jgi:glyoxylase-like metal-dependent hydrolase (beta-lactamase superfamily II)
MRITDRIAIVGDGHEGLGISNFFDCHVYVVDCGETLVLVDAGGGVEHERIVENIRADGLDPGRVSAILLTHSHGDHAGGAAKLARDLGADIVVGRPEHAMLAAGDEDALGVTLGRAKGFYPPDYVFAACPQARPLDDGDICLRTADCSITAVATPGHTRGSVSFLLEADGLRSLFTGDFLFSSGVAGFVNAPGCDLADYRESVAKVAALPRVDALFPGHFLFVLRNAHEHHIAVAARAFEEVLLPKTAW